MIIHVRTGSRLHFGLLNPYPNQAPRYGGAGLMIEHPGIELTLQHAHSWSIEGPLADRASRTFDRLTIQHPKLRRQPYHVRIQCAAPLHVGLGTGTQLALAIARGVAEFEGWSDRGAVGLARLVGRGQRSAIGTHGFEHGGFLVDCGKQMGDEPSALLSRSAFPDQWRVALFTPEGIQGRWGEDETAAFDQLGPPVGSKVDCLAKLLVQEVLPAVRYADFRQFSAAIQQYNRQAGEFFAGVQGGAYGSAQVSALVDLMTRLGCRGTGQSSWGPTVFAFAKDEEEAHWLHRKVTEAFARSALPARLQTARVTSARNEGAAVTVE